VDGTTNHSETAVPAVTRLGTLLNSWRLGEAMGIKCALWGIYEIGDSYSTRNFITNPWSNMTDIKFD
jgi:hypothetical protein